MAKLVNKYLLAECNAETKIMLQKEETFLRNSGELTSMKKYLLTYISGLIMSCVTNITGEKEEGMMHKNRVLTNSLFFASVGTEYLFVNHVSCLLST